MPEAIDPTQQTQPQGPTVPAPIGTPTGPIDVSLQQPLPPAAPPALESKVVTIPQHTIGKMKREAAAKGQLALARELGFDSVEAMKAAHAKPATPPPAAPARQRTPAPPAPPAPVIDPAPQGESRREARARQELEEKNRVLAREKAKSEKALREARRDLDAKDAEIELKMAAVKEGVQDVDYALTLLQRHLRGRSEAELTAFNETEFFRGLRKTHPILFGEVRQLATTGTGGNGDEPSKPPTGPKTPAQETNGAGPIDARSLSKADFDKILRDRGLMNPNDYPSS